ncbi:MAG: YvcK family protein, partial [Anaerolineales bacterium]|nr:YvcK family protein [Anaerolineales bacterium]
YRDFRRSLRWFTPGLGVKRWLGVILLGTTLLGIGVGIYVLEVYRGAPDTWWLPILSIASLRELERPIRVLIFGGLGLALVFGGVWGLNKALITPFIRPGQPIVESLSTHRRRERGPRVVVIGGGHGLSMLLRGLKAYTHRLTAVVTVADDGGSSGRLRESMGIIPPGDLRNCLAALSDDETMITQLFQYRFANGGGGLDGHSFGNLFISALSDITGSFEDAVAESGKVLAIHGRVLPSSLVDVQLVGEVILPEAPQVSVIRGESKITGAGGRIQRVYLLPDAPPAYPEVLQAILSADFIIIGPGSLFTSVLPNLLVPDIAAAIRVSQAFKVYVCNVATQHGETESYTCGDHIRALEDHSGSGLIDLIVQNNSFNGKLLKDMQWVTIDKDAEVPYPIYETNLIDETEPWHHDSNKLASVLMDLYQERTGPLSEQD